MGEFSELFETTVSVFESLDIVFSNAGIMNDRFWELQVDVKLVSQITIYTYIYISSHIILSFVFCLHALILFTYTYFCACYVYCNSNYRSAVVRESYALCLISCHVIADFMNQLSVHIAL
jgi:hypothetical protein